MDGNVTKQTERGRKTFRGKITRPKAVTHEACQKCRHCCTYEVIPIGNVEDKILELAHYKGLTTFWDPCVRQWFISFYRPCQNHSKHGCKIYIERPELCRTWLCAYPGWMIQRYTILVEAGKRILRQKFGEKNYE